MALPVGTVLMDNTTVFGAGDALRAYPPSAAAWTTGGLSVDLRSLMDLLEAVVLHDQIVVDNASRDYDVWPSLGWDMLTQLDPHRTAEDILLERDLVYTTLRGEDADHWPADVPPSSELVSSLIIAALDELEDVLRKGVLASNLDRLKQRGVLSVLRRFYRDTKDFVRLVEKSYGNVLTADAHARLKTLREILAPVGPETTNFALFAFRGFFYRQLAQFASISYLPHSWRVDLISAALERQQGGFLEYVRSVSGQLRFELAAKLNSEFGEVLVADDFPLFASFIVSQASTRSELLGIAAELRSTPSAVAFRRWVREMEEVVQSQADLICLSNAQAELTELVRDLSREVGLPASAEYRQQVNVSVGLPANIATVEAPVAVRMPTWLRRVMRRRTHLVFLRQVAARSVSLAPFSVAYQRLPPG